MIEYDHSYDPTILPHNMESLINAFPGLTESAACPPEAKRTVTEFVKWAKSAQLSEAQMECAKFIVGVWTSGDSYSDLGTFDMFTALRGWDEKNKAVFLKWARNPWSGER